VNFLPGIGPVLLGTNQLLTIDPTKVGAASFVYQKSPVALDDTGVHKDKNNIAPVFGIAYTPRFAKKIFGDDATVIRAGFRVGYDDIFNNIPANMGLNSPYNLTTSQTAGVTQPGKFDYATGFNQNVPLKRPGAASGLVGFSAEDPNIRSSYLYTYNFGIQRRIGRKFSMELDYQGSSGHKLGLFTDQNEPFVTVVNPALRGNQAPNIQTFPYSNFGAVGTGQDIGTSHYNGGILTANYRAKGFFIQSSFTVSKSIDDVSAFFGSSGESSTPADPRNIALDRGPSSFDTRLRFVTLINYDIPMGPGHRFMGGNSQLDRQVFGGWNTSFISSAQSGQPFTIYNGSADFSGFNQLADRPDIIGAGSLATDYSNPDLAFDVTRFGCTRSATLTASCAAAPPPTGRVGTSGRNQYYGPHLFNTDLTIQKTFAVWGERTKLSFRSEFFNIFNHTNFSNPQRNESSASFGKITQTVGTALATSVGTTAGAVGGPRQVQLALRLSF
jgi:hypothetical protein